MNNGSRKPSIKKFLYLFTPILLGAYFYSAFATLNINLVFAARSGQQLPSQPSLAFSNFSPPQLNQGYVSFVATDTLGNQGVFTNLYGYLKNLASVNTTIPDSQRTFNNFSNTTSLFNTPGSANTAIYGNKIVFVGTDQLWQTGVYEDINATGIQLIANQSTPSPSSADANFSAFAYPAALADGGAAFWAASNGNTQGIYYADPGNVLTVLIDTNTPIPNGKGNFTAFSYPSFSKDPQTAKAFAFVGYGKDKQVGLYIMKNGRLTLIANNNTKIPGNSVGYFTDFSELSYDATTQQIAFIGKGILGQNAIFVYNNGPITPVVQQNDFIPDGVGNFKSFSLPNMENGFILFKGTGLQKQEGIYLFNLQNEMLKVISNKDHINNKAISHIAISANALSGSQLAADITFANGSSGIYLITMLNT